MELGRMVREALARSDELHKINAGGGYPCMKGKLLGMECA